MSKASNTTKHAQYSNDLDYSSQSQYTHMPSKPIEVPSKYPGMAPINTNMLPPSPLSPSSMTSSMPGYPLPSPKSNYSYTSPPLSPQHSRAFSASSLSPITPFTSPTVLDKAKLQRRHSDCIHDRPECLRHHHRRSSVAVKFKPIYLDFDADEPGPLSQQPPVQQRQQDQEQQQQPRQAQPSPTSTHVRNNGGLRRPPSPIAERILKGEFSF